MSLAWFMFLVLAGATAVSALMVVLSQHIVRAAVWLLFTLAGSAGLYFLLGAEFVGAAQLIVYVGGTLVLVVFGVMLTAQGPLLRLTARPRDWLLTGAVAAVLFVGLALLLLRSPWPERLPKANEPLPGTTELGKALVGVTDVPQGAGGPTRVSYLLPFEIISVHLLVVLIGAAYLARARRRPAPSPSQSPPTEVQADPLLSPSPLAGEGEEEPASEGATP